MKNFRHNLAAALLILSLTTTALADGQQDTGKNPPTGGLTGQIDAPPVVAPVETLSVETLSEFALDLWQSVSSLY